MAMATNTVTEDVYPTAISHKEEVTEGRKEKDGGRMDIAGTWTGQICSMKTPVVVLLSCAGLSVFCSLLTLWIIFRIKRFNGYVMIIANLAIAQMMYDLSMVLVPFGAYHTQLVYVGWRCVFGLMATLWTNVVSVVIAYAVWNRKAVDVSDHLYQIYPAILISSVVMGAMVAISSLLQYRFLMFAGFYYTARLVSILFNIVLYITMALTLHYRTRSLAAPVVDPLRALVRRFQYYPVVQVVSRLAVAWHEFMYGYSYSYDHEVSMWREVSLYFYVSTLPSLGILYFLVFINVSPGAWSTLHKELLYLCGCGHDRTINKGDNCKSPVLSAGPGMPETSTTASPSDSYPRLFSQSMDSQDTRVMSTDSLATSVYNERLFQMEGFDYDDVDEGDLAREIARLYRESCMEKEMTQPQNLSPLQLNASNPILLSLSPT